ncbi:hypothetical protein GALMADRAFT_277016 [Galerina marginata CBS 339.88]|uniref:Protein kinase domain-containing protein n=1 Tax=Galerina marginata (strain CBS 339.88) TaxID=685588 RepID=A0A067TCC7_GALM3|nr:hypothetical protein GALMADRAFT_277016 [Galerina marginata CBS 339.88]
MKIMASTLPATLPSRNAFERKKIASRQAEGFCCQPSRSLRSLPPSNLSPLEPIAGPSVVHPSCKRSDRRPRSTSHFNEAVQTTSYEGTWKVQTLGSGSYGKVYRTQLHPSVGVAQKPSNAVLKVVRLDKHSTKGIWTIRGEIEALQRIREHPPTLPVLVEQPHDVQDSDLTWWCKENASLYILFNLYSTDLHTVSEYWLNSEAGVIPTKYAKNMTYELLNGLNHIHSLGIIHRDIKPANIFVDYDGHCRIGDFGGALVLQDKDENGVPKPVHGRYFCSNFTPVLTEVYSPPEAIIPSRTGVFEDCFIFNESVDIWSLGLVIYSTAMRASAAFKKLRAVLEDRIRSYPQCLDTFKELMDEMDGQASSDLRKFVKKCCQILPQNRIQGRRALKFLEDHRFKQSDQDLRGFLPSRDFWEKARCTCDNDPERWELEATIEGAGQSFTELLSTTPALSVPKRSESDTRLEVAHRPCLRHPPTTGRLPSFMH